MAQNWFHFNFAPCRLLTCLFYFEISSYCLLSHVFLIISPLSFSFWLLSSVLSIVLSLKQCFIFLSLYLLPLSLSSSSQASYFWLLQFFCRRSSKPIFWNHFFNFLEDKKVSMKVRLVFSFQNVGSFALKRWFAFGLKIQRLKLNKKALQCTVV